MREDNTKKTVYINFKGAVNASSANPLIEHVTQKLGEGYNRFIVLISSNGGSVFDGISVYNFLKGVPAVVETHAYGSVDSIASVIFCAGGLRLSVPNCRFLLHDIGFDVVKPTRFDERLVDERLKGIQLDRGNIAKIIAENCEKTPGEVEQDMLGNTILDAEQAKDYGLVHEIRTQLFPEGAEVTNILQ